MMKEHGHTVLAPQLQALADMTRLKILLMLEARPRTVGEIVEFFYLSQPTITRHLQHLLKAGLVVRQNKAQKVFYGLNADNLRSFCVELVGCFPCCCVSVTDKDETASKRDSKVAGKRSPNRRKLQTRKKEGV